MTRRGKAESRTDLDHIYELECSKNRCSLLCVLSRQTRQQRDLTRPMTQGGPRYDKKRRGGSEQDRLRHNGRRKELYE